jgi:hypothetical protein
MGPPKWKPCPFCGKEPAVTATNEDSTWSTMPGYELVSRSRVLRVRCACGATMSRRYKRSTIDPTGREHLEVREDREELELADLAKAWNRRPRAK